MNVLVYNPKAFDTSMLDTLAFIDVEIRDFTNLGVTRAASALMKIRRDYLTSSTYRR